MIEIKQYKLTAWAKMGLREATPGAEDNLCYAKEAIEFHKKILKEKQQEINKLTDNLKGTQDFVKQLHIEIEHTNRLFDENISQNRKLSNELREKNKVIKTMDMLSLKLRVCLTFSLVVNVYFILRYIV